MLKSALFAVFVALYLMPTIGPARPTICPA